MRDLERAAAWIYCSTSFPQMLDALLSVAHSDYALTD